MYSLKSKKSVILLALLCAGLVLSLSCELVNPLFFDGDRQTSAIPSGSLCYNKVFDHKWYIVLNDNDKGYKHVAANPGNGSYSPAWSPDGQYIAVQGWNNNGKIVISLYDVGKGCTGIIIGSEGTLPVAFTPDSQQLLFEYYRNSDNFGLCIMDLDGSNQQCLLTEFSEFIGFKDDSYRRLWSC